MQFQEKNCDLQLCSRYLEIHVWLVCMDLLNKRIHIVEASGYSTLMSEESFFPSYQGHCIRALLV